MSANTKIVVLRRKELLYTGIFAALGVLFVILLLMLLLPGKAADTSGAPDSPDSTAETVMPDNVADLGRIPQSAQTGSGYMVVRVSSGSARLKDVMAWSFTMTSTFTVSLPRISSVV